MANNIPAFFAPPDVRFCLRSEAVVNAQFFVLALICKVRSSSSAGYLWSFNVHAKGLLGQQ